MRRSVWTTVAVAALALALSACGGSGDSTGGTTDGTTAPAATSAAAKSMSVGVVQYTQQIMTQAFAAMGGAAQQVVKSTDPTVNCTATGDTSVSCTIADNQGGSCDVSVSVNQSNPMFTLTMSCDNFHPDSSTLVDGAYTVGMDVNEAALQGASAGTKSAFVMAKTESSDDCSYDVTEDWPTECTDAGSNTCTAASAVLYMTYVVGPGDLTVTDSCGTYVLTDGTTMTSAVCGDLDGYVYLFTFTLNGTFNGEAVNAEYSMNCDYSSAS